MMCSKLKALKQFQILIERHNFHSSGELRTKGNNCRKNDAFGGSATMSTGSNTAGLAGTGNVGFGSDATVGGPVAGFDPVCTDLNDQTLYAKSGCL